MQTIGVALLVAAGVPGFTSTARAAATQDARLADTSSAAAVSVRCRYTATGSSDMAVFAEPSYQAPTVGVINAGDTVASPRRCGDVVTGDGGYQYAEVYASFPGQPSQIGWVFSDELTNGR